MHKGVGGFYRPPPTQGGEKLYRVGGEKRKKEKRKKQAKNRKNWAKITKRWGKSRKSNKFG